MNIAIWAIEIIELISTQTFNSSFKIVTLFNNKYTLGLYSLFCSRLMCKRYFFQVWTRTFLLLITSARNRSIWIVHDFDQFPYVCQWHHFRFLSGESLKSGIFWRFLLRRKRNIHVMNMFIGTYRWPFEDEPIELKFHFRNKSYWSSKKSLN